MDLSDCTSQSELIYEGTESMVNHARSSSPGTCLTDTTEDLQSLGDESSRTTADDELLNSYTASYGDDLPIDAGEQVRSQTKQVTFQDTVEVAALSSIASSLIDSTSEEHSQEETCKTASLGMIREEDGVIERHRQAKGYQIKETRRLSSHICEWNGDRKLLTIYSDWANHYLEKASYTNFVKDIQKDLRDGVLLADIVHAVVDERVPNLFRNPKTSSQALSNVSACLQLLRKIGVETEGVSAEGISKGELKYILGLFFNLSKYKQELKNRCLSDGVSVIPNGNNFGTTELDKSQTKFGYKACVRQASEAAASDCTTIPRTGSKPPPPGHKTDSEHFSQLPKLSKPSQPQSDSALSPSVSNVSPVSAATLSLGSDRHFKPSSSRLATVRVVPSPAPFSSPTSSSTSSGCISGVRCKSQALRTNIPINLKTRPSYSPTSQKPTKCVGKSGQNGITPSARGLTKQPSSTTASDEYSFSSYSEIASVTCDLNTAYSPKSTPNANSERSSNPSTPIKQKSATETNSEPIQDHKIDQNPSVIRPHSTLPTGNSGLPKRHFTRHPAVTSSKSTVSDGELDRSIPNLPPALPRLSADRTQLFSAVSGFESENPSDSPSSTGSGIPMSKKSDNPASSSDVRRFFHRNTSQSREGSSNVPNPVRCPEAFEKAANPNSRSPLCQRALIPQENANNLMYHRSCNTVTESALIQAQQPVIAPQRADALISPSHRVKQKQVLNYAGASNSRPMHSHEPGPCTQGHPIAVTMISHTSGPVPVGAFPHQMHPGYPGLFYAPYPIPAQSPIGVHAHGPITNPHFHQHSALPHRTPTHHQACPPNHHRQQHDQQPTAHGNLNNPPVTPMRTASAVHYLDQSSSCPPVSECSVHPANPPFVPPAVYRPQSHPIPPTRAQSLQSNPNTETYPPPTVHAVSMQPGYTQTDPSADNVIRRPSNKCLEQPNHPVLNRQPESADTSRIERMTVTHNSKRVPGLLPRQVSTDRRWADSTDQVQKVATAPNPPTSPFTSSQRARPEVETEENAPTQHRANSHAEQRQKARELYAALKHRHPTTNTELKERESNVSIQRLPLRRASTSNTQAISSPLFSTRMHSQLHPGQNEINQTSPQIDLPANSTHSPVNGKPSGTTTAKTNSQTDTEVVAKISSEQISQLFQSGDPRFRSYLQSLARHVRTTQSTTTSNQQTSHHQRANPGDSSQIQSGRIIPGPRMSTQSSVCSDDEQPKWGSLKCSNEGPSILNGSYKKSDSEMICGYQSDGGVDFLKAKDATSPSPLRSSLSTNSKDIARLDIINSLPRNLRLSVLGKDECLINLNEYNPQSVGSANGQPNLSNYTRLMQERMQEGMRAAQESLWLSEDASPSCSESGSTNKEKIASNNREESSTGKASASGSSEINEAVCELEGLNADTWSSTVVSNGGLGLRKLGIDMGQISSAILRTLTTTSTGLTPNLSDIADSNLPKSIASPNVTASSSSPNTRTPKFSWENRTGMSIRLTDKEMNGLGALGYRRISDRNHNTPSSSDLKNGTCSDIEDLLNQQERRTKALRNSNGNSADCKRALNSASDTEDLAGCGNQLVGTVYGYTLPGPNQPYPYAGYPRTSLGCIKTTAELMRPGQSYIPPKWNIPTYGANHRDRSKTEIKPAVQSSACTHSKETTSDHSNTGLSHRPESISTDDTERIYGIVPLSPTYLHRQLLPGSNAATRGTALSFNSKSSMHGTVSAPPGTPIKLPYAPPSSVVAAATTRISAGGEGSNLSLLSNASHNSAIEEKQAEEIQRLKNKLECAREEIATLTAQLATNAHVVSAFEQSLNSMSQRLQALTHTTAKKDSELHQLRATIEELRSKSGLSTTKTSSQDESKNASEGQTDSGNSDVTTTGEHPSENEQTDTRHQPNGFTPAETSPKKTSISSSKSAISGSKKNGWFRASIGKAFRKKQSPLHGYPSQSDSEGVNQSDSGPLHVGTPASRAVHSTNAADDSEQTRNTLHTPSSQNGPATVDGLSPSNSSTSSSSWSTSGISASGTSNNTGPQAPSNEADRSDTTSIGQDKGSDSQTPQFLRHEGLVSKENTVTEGAKSGGIQSSEHEAASGHREQGHAISSLTEDQGVTEPNITVLQAEVSRLRHQLSERELKLTDVQLEALASTHQVNQLRDQMSRMYSELQHLRSDNERLQMLLQQQQQTDLPVGSTLDGWQHMSEMGRTNLERRKISGSDSAASKSRIAPGCPQRYDSLGSNTKHHFDIFDGAAGYSVIQSSVDEAVDSSEHQTLYAVVCYQLGQNDGDEKSDVVQAGLVNLRRFSDWIELDTYLRRLFAEYVHRLDPTNRLCSDHAQLAGYELTSSSCDLSCTRSFQLPQGSVSHQVKDSRNGKQTSTLPVSDYANFLDACCDPVGSPRIRMHVPCSPDGYSFELILRYFLPPLLIQSYVQLLLKYGCLVLYQPGGIGRENLAYSLAQSMFTARQISQIIRLSWSNVKTTSQQLLNCLTNHPEKPKKALSEQAKISKVIMVDHMENTDLKDLHHVLENVKFDEYRKPLVDDAEAKESKFLASKFYIIGNWIGTKNDVPEFPSSIQSTNLDHFNITVRWSTDPSSCWVPVGFQSVEESSLYLAHRVRQKLIHKAVQKALDHRLAGTPFLPVQLESVKNLIGWLQEVWKLIGLLVERLRKAKATAAPTLALSPDIFTDPPVADCASVEKWFVNCWNTTIATRIHELVGQVTSETADKSGEDPTVWVIKTWPWRKLDQDEEKNLLVPLIH